MENDKAYSNYRTGKNPGFEDATSNRGKTLNLEVMRKVIVEQAKKKVWNNTTKFLVNDKLPEEFVEFVMAVKSKDPVKTARELIDFNYIAMQLLENLDKEHNVDLDDEFAFVYNYNWSHKKKTKDEKGKWIRK